MLHHDKDVKNIHATNMFGTCYNFPNLTPNHNDILNLGYRMDEDIKVSQPDRPYTMLNPASGTLDDFPPPPPRMPTR